MERHFVTFLSPGTFFAESSTLPIKSWDVDAAMMMADTVKERYNATPYAFYFSTRARSDEELDSSQVKRSTNYFLPHCGVMTLDELKAKNDPKDSILISNMECNGYDKVAFTTSGWKWTQLFGKDDVLLPGRPRGSRKAAL